MKLLPEVSVIMSVYNGEEHLDECLKSICEQTFSDFEFIIVDDASTDNTAEILERWRRTDSRIRLLRNPENKERSISRNRAIMAARAPLIAVMDADDHALPVRLALQTTFLQAHPEVQILGGDMLIYNSGKCLQHPQNNDAIRAALFFDCSIFHPTTMLRKSILTNENKWYNPSLPPTEDYGLWADLLTVSTAVFANIPEPLVRYRFSVEPRPLYVDKQFRNANVVRARILEQLGLPPSTENMRCHLALLFCNAQALGVTPAQCALYGNKLLEANARRPLTSDSALEAEVSRRVARLFRVDMLQRRSHVPGNH